MNPVPIACNLNVFDPQERKDYQTLLAELGPAIREMRELDSGYACRLPPDAQSIRTAAEFITLERRCCPFLTFSLVVEGEAEVWLHLTGARGVKALLQPVLSKLAAGASYSRPW